MSFNFSIHPLKIFFTLKALLNSLCLLFLSLRQKHCAGNVSYQTLSYSFIDFRCSKPPPEKFLHPFLKILTIPLSTIIEAFRSIVTQIDYFLLQKTFSGLFRANCMLENFVHIYYILDKQPLLGNIHE